MAIDATHEMTTHQRALIDTSFEEGQYQLGIAIFDQLRASATRSYPSPSHIRQLLYLALYTPPHIDGEHAAEPASPSKISSRQQKAHIPTQAAIDAAQKLLVSLALSTPPEVLFRGLPSYKPSSEPLLNDDEGDSHLAKQASLCISQVKDCWAMLRYGFITKAERVFVPNSRSRRRQHQDDDDDDNPDDERLSPVIESAWFTLEWFVQVFKLDEMHDGSSTLLLHQIPPSGSSERRWETNAVLDIVFHSLKSSNQRRQSLGIQLLIMDYNRQLIHLWTARLLDVNIFVESVQKRLSTSEDTVLLTIMRHLSAAPTATVFRVAVCHRYLSDASSEPKARRRPKPQPRAIRNAQSTSRIAVDAREDTSGKATTLPQNSVPSFDSILPLLKDEPDVASSGASSTSIKVVKFHLLMSYGSIQEGLSPPNRDPVWQNSLGTGETASLMASVFDASQDPVVRTLHEVAQLHLLKWTNT
ncbi:hypothetical protein ONZ45_g8727 [Pleurotus djamor]|nr:hypothetical protein ONZ45_g8727 [Pleurotus djamor]